MTKYLIIIGFILGATFVSTAQAKEIIVLKDYPIIIKCFNQDTKTFHTPANESIEDGGCLIGKNMKNILLPSKKQMKEIKEVFGDRASMITAITLMNHESQFNPRTVGCHKNGCDYGLFQIRDINGGKTMTTKEQMQWFKKRKAHQMSVGTCSRTTKAGNRNTILRCIFARHNGVLDFYAKYPSDRLREHEFYTEYFKNKNIKF